MQLGNSLLPQLIAPFMPILDAMADGVMIVDQSGLIMAVNAAMRRFYEGGDVPFPGYPLSDFNPADWVEVKRVLASGRAQAGMTMVLPSATVVVARTPITQSGQNGQVSGVVCFMQDIASMDAVVSSLSAYKDIVASLDAVLENCPRGVLITDERGVIERCNTRFRAMSNSGNTVLTGLNVADIGDESEVADIVALCIKTKKQQHRMVNSKNSTVLLQTAVPVLEGRKQLRRVVATVMNLEQLNKLRALFSDPEQIAPELLEMPQKPEALESVIREFGLISRSRNMTQVMHSVLKVSSTDSSVLLRGESGVGKSMLAGVIHRLSPRRQHPFVSINCGAIPEQLLESELFGYERGAFTGSDPKGKIGLIESGNKGTVFLDEIGELSLPMQVKLLEAIDKKSFTRVGGTKRVEVDFRILAATNRDLEGDVKKGTFRRDLYYRLNVIPITIPPLRERKEDIIAMALDMVARYNDTHNFKKRLSPEVMDFFLHHSFPGNSRELNNIIEWMLVMNEGDALRIQDLPTALRNDLETVSPPSGAREASPADDDALDARRPLKDILYDVEDRHLRRAVEAHGALHEAAQSLGMHPSTLWRKLVQHGIQTKDAK